MTLRDVAGLTGARVAPENETTEISGVASLAEAGPGDVSFFGDSRYLNSLRKTQATAVLVPEGCSEEISPICLWAENPSAAFAILQQHFAPAPLVFEPGIHPSAVVSPEARIDPTATIGACAVIEKGAKIGARSVIDAHVFIGQDTAIGEDCRLHARVVIRERCKVGNRVIIQPGAVIGADGFGYELKDNRHVKIPQTGIVQIDDDVEIGANSTVDRARFGRTWIQTGAKIDNLVMIAHNVRVGAHAILCAQAGVSGSTILGSYVTLAGQVGIAGHAEIGDGAVIGAQSGVARRIAPKAVVCGSPAVPIQDWKEQVARVSRLGRLIERVQKLEERLGPKT